MRPFFLASIAAFLVLPSFAQTLGVKILNRQESETDYTYIVPGYSNSTSNMTATCSGDSIVNCNGSANTTGWSTPARQVSYYVRGATFSLQLPDGRVAVVNCESKFKERMAGPRGNHRSCRMPIVDDIEVEFDGGKAKLKWPVSLDGKKMESETYKILGVLPKLGS